MKPLMLAVALSAWFGAQGSPAARADWRPTITPVTAPSGGNSAQPQMIVSPRGILLSWIERAGTQLTNQSSPAAAVVAGDQPTLATWIEFAEQKSSFSMRRVAPSGRTSPTTAVTAISGARASGYPRIASHRDEVVFAWSETEGAQAIVKTAAAKMALPSGGVSIAPAPGVRSRTA